MLCVAGRARRCFCGMSVLSCVPAFLHMYDTLRGVDKGGTRIQETEMKLSAAAIHPTSRKRTTPVRSVSSCRASDPAFYTTVWVLPKRQKSGTRSSVGRDEFLGDVSLLGTSTSCTWAARYQHPDRQAPTDQTGPVASFPLRPSGTPMMHQFKQGNSAMGSSSGANLVAPTRQHLSSAL